MFDLETLTLIGLTFLLAGFVKGVIGMGLPTVSLALLTVTVGLPSAMALLLAPSFVTNLWQGVAGGHMRIFIKRLWPFLLFATGMIWIGGQVMVGTDVAILSSLLGALLILYAGLSLVGYRPTIDARSERWAGPLLGTVNGILAGLTGSFVVPGVMFLQAIGLPRDMFIQAMGILFTVSTVGLAFTLGNNGLLNADLGLGSVIGVVPALIGMEIGKRVRVRLSEESFRRVFFVSVGFVGCFIVGRSIF